MPGHLVEGRWETGREPATTDARGSFVRNSTTFRSWVTPDGAPGPTGEGGFAAEAGRYHLYVSYACPWAHRTLIVRKLKGLESIIPYTSVHWHMQEKGWRFATAEDKDAPGEQVTKDPVKGHEGYTHLRDVYFEVDPEYKGRFTVPT